MAQPKQSKTSVAQLRLQQGTYSNVGQRLDFVYYDTQVIDNTITDHTFFTEGNGRTFTAGGAKTIADANFNQSGIPQGTAFDVKYLAMAYIRKGGVIPIADVNAIQQMLAETVITFRIENIDRIFQTTLQDLAGLNFALAMQEAAATDFLDHTIGSVAWKWYKLDIPIPLAALVSYRIEMQHAVAPSANLNNDKIKLLMRGELKRLS